MEQIRTYAELIKFVSFSDRFRYLMLGGSVARDTFGFDRYFNQKFYRSNEWKRIRNLVIIRDNGYDLGADGYEIRGKILIHHMNPITLDDITNSTEFLMNPDYLISVSMDTHNAIHYGNERYLDRFKDFTRLNGDTKLW